MAVLKSSEVGWVLSHDLYVKTVYDRTKFDNETKSYTLNSALFDIQVPFVKNKGNNSKLNDNAHHGSAETELVKKAHKNLCSIYAFDNHSENLEICNNKSAQSLASDFYHKLTRHPEPKFHGGNNSSNSLVSEVEGEFYLIPEKSSFYCYDINEISKHLEGQQFDFILMDPPWWNKFIRRKRKKNEAFGYGMLYDEDLTNIPIHSLLNGNGIVGVWCTNAPSHINVVILDLFKKWNVNFLTQWFWLKITKSGQPICAFSPALAKQPYERIIFGIKNASGRKIPIPENDKVIMSIPSSIHSHKPPLCEVLKPYLPAEPKCLELFARYLLPKWTSYGNEVLKLQHMSLYKECPKENS